MMSSFVARSFLKAARQFSTSPQVCHLAYVMVMALAVRCCVSSPQTCSKVAVLGAAGGIGQPLALLLKQSPLISRLSLYDIVGTPGVAADLSHIETRAQVTGHMGPEQLDEALQGCDVVVIPAGVPRKPGIAKVFGRKCYYTATFSRNEP